MLFKEKYKLNFDAWIEAYKDGHTNFTDDDLAILDKVENEVSNIYNNLQFTPLPGGGVLTKCDKRSTEVGLRIQDSKKYNYWINLYNNKKGNNIGLMFRGYNPNISFDKFAKQIESTTPGAVSMGGHGLACGGQAVDEKAATEMVTKSIPYIEQQINGVQPSVAVSE